MAHSVLFVGILVCLLVATAHGFQQWTILRRCMRVSRHNTQQLHAEVTVKNLDNNQEVKIESGSPLSLACVRSGMRLSFQCKQGTCSSCETLLNGKRVRTCITKVPASKSITVKKAPRQ